MARRAPASYARVHENRNGFSTTDTRAVATPHQAQQNALAWRIERARIPEKWTLESFPFKKQPGVAQKQMRAFAELEFIAKAENIVFIGPTGVGKTGLASSLLLKALQKGHRGRFVRAQDLFDEMYASLADRSTRKLLSVPSRSERVHVSVPVPRSSR